MPPVDRTIIGVMPQSPGRRPCCILTADLPPFRFPDSLYDLSTKLDHKYGAGEDQYFGREEVSGLLYTCALGFVDLGHTRETTDFTWFYFNWLRRKGKNRAGDTFDVQFDLPASLTLKKDVPPADHIRVARSIAYDQALFHEIVSYWLIGLGKHHSSFSPEDLVSNMVGTYVGERAITGIAAGAYGGDFDRAATAELILLLMRAQVLPTNRARDAFDQINNRWVSGFIAEDRYLRRRNFHVAPIEPWLVLVNEPACDPINLPPDFILQFPPGDHPRAFYDIEISVPPGAATLVPLEGRDLLGGAIVGIGDFDAQIQRIKAHAGSPEASGGYGSQFDQP
jgi:Protein of unknown function (DUF4056)